MRGSNVFAIASNGSPTRHTRASAGFTFVNTRRIRSPRLGRDGNASTCSRESSLRHDTLRPTAGCGRKLVRARLHVRRIAREQRRPRGRPRPRRSARPSPPVRARSAALPRAPFERRPVEADVLRAAVRPRRRQETALALGQREADVRQHQHAAVLDRAHRRSCAPGPAPGASREVERDDCRTSD